MLLPTHDHEHTDDELAEGVPTAALVGMLLWLLPALLVLAPVAALAAVFSRPRRAGPAFVDPIQAVPIWGTWTGFPSDSLGLDVEVHITSESGDSARPRTRRNVS